MGDHTLETLSVSPFFLSLRTWSPALILVKQLINCVIKSLNETRSRNVSGTPGSVTYPCPRAWITLRGSISTQATDLKKNKDPIWLWEELTSCATLEQECPILSMRAVGSGFYSIPALTLNQLIMVVNQELDLLIQVFSHRATNPTPTPALLG